VYHHHTDVNDVGSQSGKLVQAEVTSLPALLAVVSGLRRDFLHLPRRGHVTVFSALDKNLSFQSPPLARREYFTTQVRVSAQTPSSSSSSP